MTFTLARALALSHTDMLAHSHTRTHVCTLAHTTTLHTQTRAHSYTRLVPCLFESEDLVLHKSDMAVLYSLMDVARGAVDCIDVLPHLVQFEQEIDGGAEAVELDAADDDDDGASEAMEVATMQLANHDDEVKAALFLEEEARLQQVALANERAQAAAQRERENAAREEEARLRAIEEERKVSVMRVCLTLCVCVCVRVRV
jgi:hypothetical protein